MTQQSVNELTAVLPLLIQLVGLVLAVLVDSHLDKRQKRVMLIVAALAFALVVENFLEYLMEMQVSLWYPRTIAAIFGYAIRPAILALFCHIVSPGHSHWKAWVAVGLNAAIHSTALFSGICFRISEQNHYKGGPLQYTCLLVSAVLLADLLYLTLKEYRGVRKQELVIPFAVVAAIVFCCYLDARLSQVTPIEAYLTVAIVSCCLLYYIWLHMQFVREHEEDLIATQRIQIMMSQIQPHFLLNSLEVIRRVYRKEPEKADNALLKFERYLRGNMDSMAQEEPISFETELEHAQTYLELEQLRFPDELNIDYDLRCTDFLLPSLTLQPLVENAVRHGVRGKKSGEGTVTIATREYEDRYEIIVTDDGNGFDPDAVPQDDDHSHIGLNNVRERLRYAGDELRIGAGPEGSTEAVIVIPKGGVAQ